MDSVVITVTATSPCGTITETFIIEFAPFIIPNVFTPYPGTPGYNDFFEIKNLPPGSKITIWDRWGLMVYKSEDYLNDWDARGLKADVFYFILETRQKKYHGWIRVIRDEK
jgi:gliding motility-associated-like protein